MEINKSSNNKIALLPKAEELVGKGNVQIAAQFTIKNDDDLKYDDLKYVEFDIPHNFKHKEELSFVKFLVKMTY